MGAERSSSGSAFSTDVNWNDSRFSAMPHATTDAYLSAMTSAIPPSTSTQTNCPACGAVASGKFCSECGGSLGHSRCSACDVELIDGARFCHRCGLPAGAVAPASERASGSALSLPWIVAAIALLALIALVAGQRFGANRFDASAAVAATDAPTAAVPPSTRAPDISQLSPGERSMRLYDRLMILNEAGKRDSVQFFAPMAIRAYEMLGDLDLDGRYDLGRIGEISGDVGLAAAQADTILRANPKHLLGLILAAHAARLAGRSDDERRYYQRLVAADPTERPKQLAEYITHERDIISALEDARRTIRR